MLTLFTTAKPFRGHIETIQRNAIHSWTLLHPNCEIILFGDNTGAAAAAEEFNIRYLPKVDCNEFGTPLVNAMFSSVQQIALHNIIGYSNADIIFMSDFLEALQRIVQQKPKFLIVGQRWDIDLDYQLNFGADWETELRAYVTQNGQLHGPTGLDFFIFPKDLWDDIPPFIIGRPGWDNWMIYYARTHNIPVIDATAVVTAIHQNHDYRHVPQGRNNSWLGPEADYNLALTHQYVYLYTLNGANWLLTPDGLKPARNMRHVRQRLNAWLSFNHPWVRARLNEIWQWL